MMNDEKKMCLRKNTKTGTTKSKWKNAQSADRKKGNVSGSKHNSLRYSFIGQTITFLRTDFGVWMRSPRIWLTFGLAFIMCFLLSDKAMLFSREYNTTMQVLEPFVWTFGDGNSILLSSLLLLLLFADMPFISSVTPYLLHRTNRKVWLISNLLYIVISTALYLFFVLGSTCLLCMSRSFMANMWSETAAILGYSGAGRNVALPILTETLELSSPYSCAGTIFLLMLMYSLFIAGIMLAVNLRFGSISAVTVVLAVNLFGFLANPLTLQKLFHLSDHSLYRANVAVGWLSPLNHATYYMHNFGYTLLPRLWQSCLLFAVGILILFSVGYFMMKRYNFQFRGTEEQR